MLEGKSHHGLTMLFALCGGVMGSGVKGLTTVGDNCLDFRKDFDTFSHSPHIQGRMLQFGGLGNWVDERQVGRQAPGERFMTSALPGGHDEEKDLDESDKGNTSFLSDNGCK